MEPNGDKQLWQGICKEIAHRTIPVQMLFVQSTYLSTFKKFEQVSYLGLGLIFAVPHSV